MTDTFQSTKAMIDDAVTRQVKLRTVQDAIIQAAFYPYHVELRYFLPPGDNGSLRFKVIDFDEIAEELFGIHIPEGRSKVILVPSREIALQAACRMLLKTDCPER